MVMIKLPLVYVLNMVPLRGGECKPQVYTTLAFNFSLNENSCLMDERFLGPQNFYARTRGLMFC
jgi:hypothetical protein